MNKSIFRFWLAMAWLGCTFWTVPSAFAAPLQTAEAADSMTQEEEVSFDEEEETQASAKAPVMAELPEKPMAKFLIALPLIILALLICRVRKNPQQTKSLEKKTCA